jgi:hypothetical protein
MENNDHKKNLVEAYDKFSSKFNELYLKGKNRGNESMTEALDKAHQNLTDIGEFTT